MLLASSPCCDSHGHAPAAQSCLEHVACADMLHCSLPPACGSCSTAFAVLHFSSSPPRSLPHTQASAQPPLMSALRQGPNFISPYVQNMQGRPTPPDASEVRGSADMRLWLQHNSCPLCLKRGSCGSTGVTVMPLAALITVKGTHLLPAGPSAGGYATFCHLRTALSSQSIMRPVASAALQAVTFTVYSLEDMAAVQEYINNVPTGSAVNIVINSVVEGMWQGTSAIGGGWYDTNSHAGPTLAYTPMLNPL